MRKNILLTGFVFLIAGLSFQPVFSQTPASTTDNNVEYVVEDIQGANVQVLEGGAKTWDPAQEGQVLDTGDEIKVGDGSEVTLTLQNDTQVHLSANSDLKIGQIEPNQDNGFFSHLVVLAGTILSDVKKNLLESHSSFEVEAGGVVCGVRGTAFEVSNNNGDVETVTHEGQVATVSGGESHLITAGNASSFHGGHFRGMRHLRAEDMNRFKKWRSFRTGVRNKRLQRIRAIRSGRRTAWVRRHGRSPVQMKRRENLRRHMRRNDH